MRSAAPFSRAGPAPLVLIALTLLAAASPAGATAQTIRGRVLDEGSEAPVAQALVSLLDADSESVVATLADSLGRYRLELPAPGEYYLAAERLGYEPTRSPLLAVENPEGSFEVDLSVRVSPLGIPGIEVTAERFEEIRERLHLLVGQSPDGMRVQPIMRPEIEEHLARSHDVVELVRWQSIPSVEIRETVDGPCILIRPGARVKIPESCVGVYLNGVPYTLAAVDLLPLDMIEVVVVTMPSESILYPAGAVLLYTAGWIG